MPLIVVHGLTTGELANSTYMSLVEHAILGAALDLVVLGLHPKDVTFSFIHDPTITSGITDVAIIVKLLFDKPERTFQVRRQLAYDIAVAFDNVSGDDKKRLIKVAIEPFDPTKDGYAQIKP